MRVLVTGATGFVGRHLVPLLAARRHTVRAAVRRADAGLPAAETVVVPDVGPDTDWDEALRGVDAVAHLAARVHVMRDKAADPLAEFRRTNTDGTRRLAEAAASAGVRRFLYVSSIKAVADESRPRPVDDRTPAAPHSPYGVSKREAEEALTAVGRSTGMDTVILRPPLVYGPGVAGNFRTLLTLVHRGVPLPLGRVENRRSLLYVGNLADAVELGLVHPAAPGHTFLLHDGVALSTAELVRRVAAALDRPLRLVNIQPDALQTMARLLRHESAFDRVAGSLVVDDSLIRRTLSWWPPRNTAFGLRATADWFKAWRA